jgi:uncharacterized protein (TIGR03435 family)
MLQSLLQDRFKLRVHYQARDVDGYDLVVAKGGPKLRIAEPPGRMPLTEFARRLSHPAEDGFPDVASFFDIWQGSRIALRGQPLKVLDEELKRRLDKPVRDSTGLTATYTFNLTFGNSFTDDPEYEGIRPPDLFAALQQQIGLKLEPTKIALEILVIDHVETTPTDN